MADIKCSVENCEFNGKKFCHASAIEVATNGHAFNAQSSEETICRTFRPKK
ncbi:MAG: DUF1540 domain-containing protein [Firmicutes bacterium]|nr:DUF1540 domain-containing protein [Bacillota bacterium]